MGGLGSLGILSVRIIAAYNLVNADTGILGDVSDPYVTVRLESQSEKQRKRTHTINNDLNPKWNSSPFLFPIQQQGGRWQPFSLNSWVSLPPHLPERCTSLAQASRRPATPGGLRRGHDGSDDFLGRMKIPLYRIIHGRANQPVRIRDQLQDTDFGTMGGFAHVSIPFETFHLPSSCSMCSFYHPLQLLRPSAIIADQEMLMGKDEARKAQERRSS